MTEETPARDNGPEAGRPQGEATEESNQPATPAGPDAPGNSPAETEDAEPEED